MAKLKNAKRERFCQEYVKDLNATQAYIRAGYSKGGAGQSAGALLKNTEIQARITEIQAKVSTKLEITQEKVLADLEHARLAALAVGQIGPAIRAGELLGKHIGMWPNKVEATVNLLDGLNNDEQRTLAAALQAIARDEGEDAEGTAATHH